jgi:hypothetical protein
MTGKKDILDLLDRFHPLAYIAIAIIIMVPLLPQGYYIALDMQFGPNSFSGHNFKDFYGLGANSYGGQLPLNMALASVSDIISVEWAEKILLFAILAMCGIGMHTALPKELGISRYFAGLLHMINPFVFLRFLVGHWALLLSYAFFPLAVFSFIDFLKKPNDWSRLANAALMATMVSLSSHGAVLLALCFSILLTIYIAKNGFAPAFLRQALVLALISLALNLYWILPICLNFGEGYSTASSLDYLKDFGSKGIGMPLYQALLTMHGFWREGFEYTKDIFALWHVPFFAILALSLFGLFHLSKKDRALAIFLALTFLISFFLAAGINGPFAPLFFLPFIDTILSFMFRDTQKFVWLIAFCLSALGAYGAYAISASISNLKSSGTLKNSALLIFMAIVLSVPIICNYGFFGFIGQAGTTNYPEDWKEAERIMSSDNSPGSILVLPLHMYMYYPWVNNTAKTIGNPQSQFFSRDVIGSANIETGHVYQDINDPVVKSVSDAFENKSNASIAQSLAQLNISYVILVSNIADSPHYLNILNGSGSGLEKALDGPNLVLFRNALAGNPADGNGMAGNSRFYTAAFLLVVSLSLFFILFAGLGREYLAHALIISLLAFILACFGILGPHQLGFAMILAFLVALAARLGYLNQRPIVRE